MRIFLLLPLLTASCAAVPAAYMDADAATYRAVAPEHRRYLLNDPALTDLEHRAALTTLDLWHARLSANGKPVPQE